MQVLKKLPPKKTWRLARNKVTGRIYTENNRHVYCGTPDEQQAAIDAAKAHLAATGENTPEGSTHRDVSHTYDPTIGRYRHLYNNKTGPCMSDVELYDHIPVLRIDLKIHSIYNGTSGAAIMFEDGKGYQMILRNAHTNKFFKLVGAGKIPMGAQGVYTFDVTFTKAGEKIYMELYGYDD